MCSISSSGISMPRNNNKWKNRFDLSQYPLFSDPGDISRIFMFVKHPGHWIETNHCHLDTAVMLFVILIFTLLPVSEPQPSF